MCNILLYALNEDESAYDRYMQYKFTVPMQQAEHKLFAPDPQLISIEYICQCLGGMYRYNNGSPRPLSVAEHCIMVYKLAVRGGEKPDVLLACLLHDAEEAYLGDIVSPLKQFIRDNCPGYTELLIKWLDAICAKFVVNGEPFRMTAAIKGKVKKYDKQAERMEQEYYHDMMQGNVKFNCRNHPWFYHYEPALATQLLLGVISKTYKSLIDATAKAGIEEGLKEANNE